MIYYLANDCHAGIIVDDRADIAVNRVHTWVVEAGVVVGMVQNPLVSFTCASGRPDGLAIPCATSMRKPSTPCSSQKRSVFSTSSKTSRVVLVQIGLLCVEEVQIPLAGSAARFVHPRPGRPAEQRVDVTRIGDVVVTVGYRRSGEGGSKSL